MPTSVTKGATPRRPRGGGGTSIAVSTLLCRTLNDAGVCPATLLALRFPGAVVLAAALALVVPGDVFASLTPGGLAGIALASFALIVLPNYVNQAGVALASPVTVRAVLAVAAAVARRRAITLDQDRIDLPVQRRRCPWPPPAPAARR